MKANRINLDRSCGPHAPRVLGRILLCLALLLFPLAAFAQTEAISREVSVFNFGSPPTATEAITREVSLFNFGSPSASVEGITREVSLFNFGSPSTTSEAISREASLFNFGTPSSNLEAISREVSFNDLTNGSVQIYETNLVVVRLGDGTQTLTTSGNSIFLDQFDTSGNFVDTMKVPDTGPMAVVMSGASFVEGYLTRSLDHSLLCLAVYGTNVGSGVNVTTSAAVPRVVATFDAAFTYNQAVMTTSDYSGVNWRSAATDGTNNFWGAGSAGGTLYLGNQGPHTVVQNSKPNDRVVQVFNGKLYMGSASTTGDGLTGIYKFNGLPQTTVGLPAAIVFTNTFTSPNGVTDFAVNSNETIIYFADDRVPSGIVGGIQRWDFNSGVWVNSYRLTNGIGAVGASHLEVDWSGSNPVIYAVTAEAGQNRLVKVTDTGLNSSFTTLATAGANQLFRGVKFGPAVAATFIATQPQSQSVPVGGTARSPCRRGRHGSV